MSSPAAPQPPIAHRDLVVMGASAGGVETLKQVVGRFPSDLPAAVCVVLHIAPGSPSALAGILARSGPLPCRAARDGDALVPGEIVVAPPDRHLVVEDGKVRLSVGPRENGHRPAVDTLFRTAAHARGRHVVGVVLSGTRDDGTHGLALIKAHGGAAIVQDPDDALYPGMPASAIATVEVDAVVASHQVAQTIAAMVTGGTLPTSHRDSTPIPDPPGDSPGVSICPECGGVLTERAEAGTLQWRCRVGHRYSPESLIDAQAADVEAALWTAVRALEDRRIMLERMAEQFEARSQRRSARSLRKRAADAERQAGAVRDALAVAAQTTFSRVDADDDADTAQAGEVA